MRNGGSEKTKCVQMRTKNDWTEGCCTEEPFYYAIAELSGMFVGLSQQLPRPQVVGPLWTSDHTSCAVPLDGHSEASIPASTPAPSCKWRLRKPWLSPSHIDLRTSWLPRPEDAAVPLSLGRACSCAGSRGSSRPSGRVGHFWRGFWRSERQWETASKIINLEMAQRKGWNFAQNPSNPQNAAVSPRKSYLVAHPT